MVKEVPYEVVSKKGGLEIRRYPPILIAKVSGIPDNASFSILFDYIKGANRSKRKVPMTAPVISSEKVPMTSPVLSDGGSFSFVMPDGMDSEDVPLPADPRVSIERIEKRTLAVLRFRGSTSPKRTMKYYERLMERLGSTDMGPSGRPFLMRYDPPFVPWPFRRNEVAVPVSCPE